MSSDVLHRRPAFTADRIKTSLVPGAPDWLAMGDAANWVNGHGAQVVPFAAATEILWSSNTSFTVQSTIAFSARAVGLEVFATFFSEEAAEVTLQVSGAGLTTTSQTVALSGLPSANANAYAKLSVPLTSRQSPSTPRLVTFTFTRISGEFGVIGYGAYEQTRSVLDLDTTDYGAETASLNSRRPIADFPNASAGGLIDAYKNLDARRTGYFSASMDSTAGIALTATTQTDILPFHVQMQAPIDVPGATELELTITFRATTDTGTATIYFDTDVTLDNQLQVVDTSTADYSVSTYVASEDFAIADGRRGSAWEGLRVSYACDTGTTLTLYHLTILRTTTPI